MVRRLFAWFWRHVPGTMARKLWQAERRGIFAYRDGQGWCFADPTVVHRRLEEAGGENWPDLFEKALVGDGREARAAAGQELIRIARLAFDAAPVSRRCRGLTEPETIDLLIAFLAFCKSLADQAQPEIDLARPSAPVAALETP